MLKVRQEEFYILFGVISFLNAFNAMLLCVLDPVKKIVVCIINDLISGLHGQTFNGENGDILEEMILMLE